MSARTIEKSVHVAAPPERVWSVLLDDTTYRRWTAAFMPGSYAETDWQEGSTVRFVDPSRTGMLGRVLTSRYPELVDIEYDGIVTEGRDDTDSDAAREYRGTRETYRLTPTDGGTHLAVSAPSAEEYYDDMVAAWDRALATLKELAEAPSGG
ncbi:SRPBCC family protein [Aquipuribacter sp. SD81]|uniref:SRPBCC family protein n=1 Tax=Aquipuribacter sp. SD81 TaxID=3127703 RepID=UPI003017A93B